jgi:nucleoside-diphosphate-sugar epimerase
MKFTILGSSGFIGSHLANYFNQLGISYYAPLHNDPSIFENNLGHLIYCIGLTADFRQQPFNTVKAHVCYLLDILENADFESLLYLSSTRMYLGSKMTNEDKALSVNPIDKDNLYNISKIMGEALCLSSNRPNVRVIRLSNVYGYDHKSTNFLTSIIQEALINKKVVLRSSLESAKDYVSIDDVVSLIPQIAVKGQYSVYNVASGININNQILLANLQELTGCTVEVSPKAEAIIFPKIAVNRICNEFNFYPVSLLDRLENLVDLYRQK